MENDSIPEGGPGLNTQAQDRSSGPSRIRVLIAEDDPVVRKFLGELLDREDDLELVGQVADASEAVAMAERVQPDVALVDVRMPHGGGQEAARGIADRSTGTNVMAFTAQDDPFVVMEMVAAGAVGFVLKDAGAEEIVAAIRRVAAGGEAISPAVDVDVRQVDVEDEPWGSDAEASGESR